MCAPTGPAWRTVSTPRPTTTTRYVKINPHHNMKQKQLDALISKQQIQFATTPVTWTNKATNQPVSMDPPAYWEHMKKINSGPYGSGAFRYAQQYALLMQVRMAAGATLKDCFDQASQDANTEGVTGFMHSCAVALLRDTWIHGKELVELSRR